jgi:hypothetical protein
MPASVYVPINTDRFNFNKNGISKLELVRLDSVFKRDEIKEFDYWVIDVQGAELEVLKGAGELLDYAKFLFVEVSTFEIYSGQATFDQVHTFLCSKGFVSTIIPSGAFHGDVLFLRQF